MKKDIDSSFTIDNAKSISEVLGKYIKAAAKPVIDLSAIERIDLSGIQLLISAQKSGEKAGKTVYYAGRMETTVYNKFISSGFTTVYSEDSEDLFSIRRNSSEF